MRYVSTRGLAPEQSFRGILLSGLASDGGLYLPAAYPRVAISDLDAWSTLSYADLAFEILRRFADDIPAADLAAMCRATYTPQTYCYGRPDSEASAITPVRQLEGEPDDGLLLQELSNGPTLAFKDMAMQLLGALFEYALRGGGRLNILGATSGDTGSAAEYAMRGRRGVQVFMLSPHGRMSAFQRAQMYSLQDANIHNLAVEGGFDDCQDIVKAVSSDLAFKQRHAIGTVNSINWARVAAQVVYYFRGWFAARARGAQRISFCVPSGNFGNIFAGWVARQMGLPIERLLLATNENDVLDEFFRTGRYRVRPAAETHVTSSPSMDIAKASNFERFVYDIVERDPARVRALWAELERDGQFDLLGTPAWRRVQASGFASGSSTHADRLETIRDVHARTGLVIDPHTADGVRVARVLRRPGETVVCLETALPAKFAETIRAAIGREPPRPPAYAGIEERAQRVTVLPIDVQRVKHAIAAHAA